LNGAVDGTFTTGSFNSFTVNAIGQNGASGEYYDNVLDDVRIYNRAISAAEVAQLYNYGLPKFTPTAGRLGQGIDSTQSYVNPGNVSSSVNSFSFWMKTASSSPTVNLLDLNASQSIKIVGGTVTASGLTSPSIFVDGASGTTVNAGWHHIAVTTGTAVNASAVNLGLNATTTAPLDGVLDDVRFYNRVINNDEIKRLYRIGATLKINTDVSRDNPDLERGLVGYWSFDGKDMAGVTAYDRSGQNNNGTLTNGPARAIGKIGQALNFDGVDDFIATPSFDLTGTNVVSVSMWEKHDTTGFIDVAYEFSTDINAVATGFNLVLDTPDCDPQGIFVALKGDVGLNAACYTPPSVKTWHHYLAIYDKSLTSSEIKLYIDGVLQTPYSTPFSSNNTNNFGNVPLYLMSRAGTAWQTQGQLDDVRIYNRALSADEIKRLYNLGR